MTHDEFAGLALSYLEESYAYALRLSRTRWDADDLAQAAFEQAFQHWRTLREPARCRAWLFRIMRNLYIDQSRAITARSELRLVRPDDPVMAEAFVPSAEMEYLTMQELELALGHLPGNQREAVLLCDLWGFQYEEIAVITSVPVGTVRSRISRARSALSGLLAANREDAGKMRDGHDLR